MASVSADDVRDVINVTSGEVPDDKISKIIRILGFLTQNKVYLFWKKDEHCTKLS